MDPQPLNPEGGNEIPQNHVPVSHLSVEVLKVLWGPDTEISSISLSNRLAMPDEDGYDIETVKTAFERVDDKPVFLQAAFQRIALPENEENAIPNIRILLELCQGKVEPEIIVEAFGNQMAKQFEGETDESKLIARLKMLADANEPEIIPFAKESNPLFILARLMDTDKLPDLALSSPMKETIVQNLFSDEDKRVLMARLILADKLPVCALMDKQELKILFVHLFKKDEVALLARLMLADKFLTYTLVPELFQPLAQHLLDKDEVALLARLMLTDKFLTYTLVPELFQTLAQRLLDKDEVVLLARLILDCKFPTPNKEASENLAQRLLYKNEAVLLAELMCVENLTRFELSPEASKDFAKSLVTQKALVLLTKLICAGKLPGFEPTLDFLRKIGERLLTGGEVSLVAKLMCAGKLPDFILDKEQSAEFVRSLLKGNKDGVDGAIALIDRGMLPNLDAAEKESARAHAIGLQGRHAVLQTAISEAFGKPLEIVRQEQRFLKPREVRKIWQTIANKIAPDCFDGGKVAVEKLEIWQDLLGSGEIFKGEPYSFIPHVELMRSQMHRVCECLIANKNGVRDQLDAAKDITIITGSNGEAILLYTMPLGNPAVAMLASYFTPPRQGDLPACTIYSWFNAVIWNYPEQLISIYRQMFEAPQFVLPSGYAILQRPMHDSSITVDLKNGGSEEKGAIFGYIDSNDPHKIQNQKDLWNSEGIGYDESTNPEGKYRLTLPIYNMNDVLFANILEESSFGNKRISSESTHGTALLLAGHQNFSDTFKFQFDANELSRLAIIEKLKEQAEGQKRLGNHYMHIGIQLPKDGHALNIDIDALLAIDPNTMEPGMAYPIGDSNYYGKDPSQDIPRLAIRRRIIRDRSTLSIYEFGTLENGVFKNDQIKSFMVYNTGIEHRDAEFWKKIKEDQLGQDQPAP
ncbi:MAG: hypothetical protein LBC11_00460 [Puniceicoccales bacterium]|jgi:hypothetical protein|nr:hypothetical protein [Puniceicoccales bacterium]